MTSISPDDARNQFGIVARHSEMVANKERRFRLEKNDGTAYIRTEASEKGGWQNSHHHEHTTETYIVQSGWMAAAELRGGAVTIRKYLPGEIYSTESNVVHNIFLPADAVIHTIKHGLSAPGDWHGNTHAAGELNSATKDLREADINARAQLHRAQSRTEAVDVERAVALYSDDYRHFDQLIWQVPAWSSAVFAIAVASISSNTVFLERLTSESGAQSFSWVAAFWTAFYGIVCFALGVFGMALFRFRRRQIFGVGKRVPFMKSAQFGSMALVTLEASFFFAVALITAGAANMSAVLCASIVWLVVMVVTEVRLRRSPQPTAQSFS